MKKLIVVLISLVLIGCFDIPKYEKPTKDKDLVGSWQFDDVVYTFYQDHTGVIWDSIEGDTIYEWSLYGEHEDSLFLVTNDLYRDTTTYRISIRCSTMILENTVQFRKLEK